MGSRVIGLHCHFQCEFSMSGASERGGKAVSKDPVRLWIHKQLDLEAVFVFDRHQLLNVSDITHSLPAGVRHWFAGTAPPLPLSDPNPVSRPDLTHVLARVLIAAVVNKDETASRALLAKAIKLCEENMIETAAPFDVVELSNVIADNDDSLIVTLDAIIRLRKWIRVGSPLHPLRLVPQFLSTNAFDEKVLWELLVDEDEAAGTYPMARRLFEWASVECHALRAVLRTWRTRALIEGDWRLLDLKMRKILDGEEKARRQLRPEWYKEKEEEESESESEEEMDDEEEDEDEEEEDEGDDNESMKTARGDDEEIGELESEPEPEESRDREVGGQGSKPKYGESQEVGGQEQQESADSGNREIDGQDSKPVVSKRRKVASDTKQEDGESREAGAQEPPEPADSESRKAGGQDPKPENRKRRKYVSDTKPFVINVLMKAGQKNVNKTFVLFPDEKEVVFEPPARLEEPADDAWPLLTGMAVKLYDKLHDNKRTTRTEYQKHNGKLRKAIKNFLKAAERVP